MSYAVDTKIVTARMLKDNGAEASNDGYRNLIHVYSFNDGYASIARTEVSIFDTGYYNGNGVAPSILCCPTHRELILVLSQAGQRIKPVVEPLSADQRRRADSVYTIFWSARRLGQVIYDIAGHWALDAELRGYYDDYGIVGVYNNAEDAERAAHIYIEEFTQYWNILDGKMWDPKYI